ncbi:hypothetical protein L1987_35670 [Smallanthus sonchifolius]|uniref:Uncharacterized protein n=1 Tax=Smallanthus sonchifolius TaxID=185202 RepID=A0ACB9HB18_9ASTR|nr:hypothetical protein L1987_35670 [Smallanthus sonchifolius]
MKRMGDRKKDGRIWKKSKTIESNWPPIKPKSDLRITSIKDQDLFTMIWTKQIKRMMLPWQTNGYERFTNYWNQTTGNKTTLMKRMGDRKKDGRIWKKSKTIESNWPPIKPKSDLRITSIKDQDLFTVQNFLTAAESKAFIKAAESIGFVHQGSLGPTKGEAYRDNDRIAVNDPVLADTLWESGLSKLLSHITIRGKVPVGLNPNIRLYRYNIGQRFGRHIDESVDLGEGKHTHYTLLIYLNGNVELKPKADGNGSHDSFEPLVGGETVFYGPRNSLVAEVSPTQGMALFHIHGAKCMLHESRNVTKGVKYILRSDVAFA